MISISIVLAGEAEFYSLASGISQRRWRTLAMELFNYQVVMKTQRDSRAVRGIATRCDVGKIKHLDMRVLLVHETMASGILKLHWVSAS